MAGPEKSLKLIVLLILLTLTISPFAGAVTWKNCATEASTTGFPEKALAIDINSTEMMLALGLGSRLAGVSAIYDRHNILDIYRDDLDGVPVISVNYPTMNDIRESGATFVVGGWNYGFSRGGRVTPERLQDAGIGSYVLGESCHHAGDHRPVGIRQSLFPDLLTLGRIFGVGDKAASLVDALEERLQRVERKVAAFASSEPVRIFVYDSGLPQPYTSGARSVINDVIRLAGGRSITGDLPVNWGMTTWDEVAARDPQFIIIVDYGYSDGTMKARYLQEHQALADTSAIRNNRLLIIPYSAAVTGVRSPGLADLLADQLICEFHASTISSSGEFSCSERPF